MASGNQIGLKKSFGYIWMNTGNWTGVSFAFTTAYQEMRSLGTNFTLASPSQDFVMTTDGQLKYTGVTTKLFNVDALLQTGSTSSYAIQIYLNGSPIAGAEDYEVGGGIMMICRLQTLLSTNDYISIFAKKSTAASVTIMQLALSATFAGGM